MTCEHIVTGQFGCDECRTNRLREENKRLREAVKFACECFERITSGDGSGHADLARATKRIAGEPE